MVNLAACKEQGVDFPVHGRQELHQVAQAYHRHHGFMNIEFFKFQTKSCSEESDQPHVEPYDVSVLEREVVEEDERKEEDD